MDGLRGMDFQHMPHLGRHDGVWYSMMGYCGSGLRSPVILGLTGAVSKFLAWKKVSPCSVIYRLERNRFDWKTLVPDRFCGLVRIT